MKLFFLLVYTRLYRPRSKQIPPWMGTAVVELGFSQFGARKIKKAPKKQKQEKNEKGESKTEKRTSTSGTSFYQIFSFRSKGTDSCRVLKIYAKCMYYTYVPWFASHVSYISYICFVAAFLLSY